jgi:hypothetical protein
MSLSDQMTEYAGLSDNPKPAASLSDQMQQFADESKPAAPPPPGPPPTALDRAKHGLGDAVYGLGRLTQHVVPDVVLNGIRKGIGLDPQSTEEWDKIATDREQNYQSARAAANQTGIDWWRLAGAAANPLNYAAPARAATVLGRVGQAAAQGGALGGIQSSAESTTPDSFWWDAARGSATGAGAGGVLGGVVETVAPALRWGLNKSRALVSGQTQAAIPAAADAVVKQALQGAGVQPHSVDLNLLSGMRQDVQSALEHGADISPNAIVNRARAESLPVPINLTRGQATGDAMQFAKEQNLRGVTGVGEPITQRLTSQNAGFIANLDALGAKDATDTVSWGAQYAPKVQAYWDKLQSQKDALYSAVRNSKGQSAAVDGISAADSIKAALDTPQASHAYDLLPSNIKKTIDSLRAGDFPLTIAQSQALDKQWSAMARGTTDGSVAYAINKARALLESAPIADDVGAEARQAYQAAKQAHAQQMSLIDPKLPNGMPNPNFQPIVKAVVQDGKDPSQLFGSHFLNSPPSVARKNVQFLSQIDPNAPKDIGQTLMGEIKRQALTSASDERGTVSEAVLRNWANDPVKSARLDALLPQPAVHTFHNLAATVEAAKKIPVASAVNTSNSGSAVVNAATSMLQNSAFGQIAARLPLARSVAEGMAQANRQTDVQAALQPGVTLKNLMSATPAQAARRSLTTRALLPAAVGGANQSAQGLQNE